MLVDGYVTVAGLPLHYNEAGVGPPLVFLHALGRDASNWDEVIGRLATRYRCLAFDQRGHGSSGRPGLYSFELLRDDLLSFVDQLELERFTLIGHSMGANVAWLFVQDHSERVERLVIEDTAPPSTRHTYPEVPEVPPEPVSYDWQVRRALFTQLNNPDPAWWDQLSTIAVPTLLVAGTSGDEDLAEVRRRVPNSQLVTIEAGHWVHEARPIDFVEALVSFLES